MLHSQSNRIGGDSDYDSGSRYGDVAALVVEVMYTLHAIKWQYT